MSGPVSVAYYRGDDTYSLERAAGALADRLAQASGTAVERWRTAGATADPAAIAERVATAPLFGGGTVVTIADLGSFLGSREARRLAALLAVIGGVAPGNGLVILDPTDRPRDKPTGGRARVVEAVTAAGGDVREFAAPREGRMTAWIEERARELGLQLGRGAAQELAERVGAFVREGDVDRRRMGQLAVAELEKLALYRPDAPIGRDDVRALVGEVVPASAWAFLDAVGARQARPAADLLERLLDQTAEPVVLTMLHRRIRELIEVADRLAGGERLQEIARVMRLNPYVAEKHARHVAAWTLPDLEAALNGLVELDALVKGVESGTERQRRLAFELWLVERVAPR